MCRDEDRQPQSNIAVRQAVEQRLEVADLADTTRELYDDLIRLDIRGAEAARSAGACTALDAGRRGVGDLRRGSRQCPQRDVEDGRGR